MYMRVNDLSDPKFIQKVARLRPDYLFSADNQQKFPPALLATARVGGVNFHNGPLPAYRGSNIPTWAIWNRESSHAISWHWMLDKIDAGATILESTFPISADETAATLTIKCVEAGKDSAGALLQRLESAAPSSVDYSEGGYYYLRSKVPCDGLIDATWSASRMWRLYRALNYSRIPTHTPPPRLLHEGQQYTIKSVERLQETYGPIEESNRNTITLERADGRLVITTLEPVGG